MGAKLQDGKLIPSPYIWKCPVEAQRGLGGPADGHDQEVGTCKHPPASPRTTLTTSRAASESTNGTHTPKRLPHHHPPSHTTHHAAPPQVTALNMCRLRSIEYTYCSAPTCRRLCHVRSKLRPGTDRFCRDRTELNAHQCYITRQRMAADEQACREANERARREEEAEAEAEATRNGGRGRRRGKRRERREPDVSVGSNADGTCDACDAVARGVDAGGGAGLSGGVEVLWVIPYL